MPFVCMLFKVYNQLSTSAAEAHKMAVMTLEDHSSKNRSHLMRPMIPRHASATPAESDIIVLLHLYLLQLPRLLQFPPTPPTPLCLRCGQSRFSCTCGVVPSLSPVPFAIFASELCCACRNDVLRRFAGRIRITVLAPLLSLMPTFPSPECWSLTLIWNWSPSAAP
jgi:hypothetical protein